MDLVAFAILDTFTHSFINFASKERPKEFATAPEVPRGLPYPDFDIRHLRTEQGCRAWVRGNRYRRRDQDGRYRLVKINLIACLELSDGI